MNKFRRWKTTEQKTKIHSSANFPKKKKTNYQQQKQNQTQIKQLDTFTIYATKNKQTIELRINLHNKFTERSDISV